VGSLPDALNKLFTSLGNWAIYFVAVASLGALTMAILEAVKDITPARRWFQKVRMRTFLQAHSKIAKQNLNMSSCWSDAESQLVVLATDGDSDAFYDLEIEKLCGQWNTANQIVIDYPTGKMDLLTCLAARSAPNDLKIIEKRDLPDQLGTQTEILGCSYSRVTSNTACRRLLPDFNVVSLEMAFADSVLRYQFYFSNDRFEVGRQYRYPRGLD
jgi:hypothetical protein